MSQTSRRSVLTLGLVALGTSLASCNAANEESSRPAHSSVPKSLVDDWLVDVSKFGILPGSADASQRLKELDSHIRSQRAKAFTGLVQIYFPAGRYSLQPGREPALWLDERIEILGDGSDRSIIEISSPSGEWSCLFDTRTSGSSLTFFRLYDLSFEHAVVDSGPPSAHLPRIVARAVGTKSSVIQVSNCRFSESASINVLYMAGAKVDVTGNRFEDVGRSGAYAWDHSSVYATARPEGTLRVESNIFRGVAGGGGAVAAIETHGGRQIVRGNTIEHYRKGMNITGISEATTGPVNVTDNHLFGVMIAIHLWSGIAARGQKLGLRGAVIERNRCRISMSEWANARHDLGDPYLAGVVIDSHPGALLEGVSITQNRFEFKEHDEVPMSPQWKLSSGVLMINSGDKRDIGIKSNEFISPWTSAVYIASTASSLTIQKNNLSSRRLPLNSFSDLVRIDFAANGVRVLENRIFGLAEGTSDAIVGGSHARSSKPVIHGNTVHVESWEGTAEL